MENMEMKEIESAIEGILFASGEPLPVDRICVALEIDRPTVEQVLQKLMDYYAYERRGIRLLRIEDSWQLCSAPDYADVIRKAFEIRKPAKLSQPALEVQVPGRPRLYRTTKQFLRAFHLTSLDDLPEVPDLGGEGQMRLTEDGQIVDPAEAAEITGADTPEEASFPESGTEASEE